MIKTLITIVTVLLFALVILFVVKSYTTRHDTIKAPGERQLDDCPNKPNCVSSLATRSSQQIGPLQVDGAISPVQWQRAIEILRGLGAQILVDDGDYCHAVFTSRLFRFKDDVELRRDDAHIHIRSASRAGTSDLGVNRKRVEKIRALWQETN